VGVVVVGGGGGSGGAAVVSGLGAVSSWDSATCKLGNESSNVFDSPSSSASLKGSVSSVVVLRAASSSSLASEGRVGIGALPPKYSVSTLVPLVTATLGDGEELDMMDLLRKFICLHWKSSVVSGDGGTERRRKEKGFLATSVEKCIATFAKNACPQCSLTSSQKQ